MKLRAIISVAVMSTLACGGDNRGTVIDDVCAEGEVYQTLIAKLFACNPELAVLTTHQPSAADVSRLCYDSLLGFLDNGSISLADPLTISVCINELQATDCSSFDLRYLTACRAIVLGQLSADESCESDQQCAAGLYCQFKSDTCGSCAPTLPTGEPCTDGSQCDTNFCHSEGLCADPGLENSACSTDEDCAGRLWCNAGFCDRRPDWQVGDACTDFDKDCDPFRGTYCNRLTLQCTSYLALGADCSDGVGTCNVVVGETCDTADSNTCVAASVAQGGAPCGLEAGVVCAPRFECSSVFEAGICVPVTQSGHSCDPNDTLPCGRTYGLTCINDVCQYGEFRGECPLGDQ